MTDATLSLSLRNLVEMASSSIKLSSNDSLTCHKLTFWLKYLSFCGKHYLTIVNRVLLLNSINIWKMARI